ncbi:MAG: hypothetical protein AAF735_05160 [Myxococcota bacterium]
MEITIPECDLFPPEVRGMTMIYAGLDAEFQPIAYCGYGSAVRASGLR